MKARTGVFQPGKVPRPGCTRRRSEPCAQPGTSARRISRQRRRKDPDSRGGQGCCGVSPWPHQAREIAPIIQSYIPYNSLGPMMAEVPISTNEDEARIEASRVAFATVPLASVSRAKLRDGTAVLAHNLNERNKAAQEPAPSSGIAPPPGPRPSASPAGARPPLASATRAGSASSYAPAAEVPAGLSGLLTGAGLPLAGAGGDEDEAGDENELIGGPLGATDRSWRSAGSGSGAQVLPASLPPGGWAAPPAAAPLTTPVKESDDERMLKAAFAAGSILMPEFMQMQIMASMTARLTSAASAAAASTDILGARSSGLAGELVPAALALGGGCRQTANSDPIARAIRLHSQQDWESLEADARIELGVASAGRRENPQAKPRGKP